MGDTVIETVETVATETEDTVDDHERMTREKDSTRATVTKRILASCGDIRCSRTLSVCLVVGFSSIQSFFPSSPGVSGFRCYFHQGSMPSPHLYPIRLHYSHRTKTAIPIHHGNNDLRPSGFRLLAWQFHWNLEGPFHVFNYFYWVSKGWR